MAEFNNNENPCKNCLIKAICRKGCILLYDYAGKIVREEDHKINLISHWYKHYELRPRVREYHEFKTTQIKEAIKTHRIEVKDGKV